MYFINNKITTVFQSHDTIFRLEELQICFVAWMRIYVTPVMATRSTTVDMTVKWLIRLRKQIELWNFL
jgi:hypothetical protein